MKIIKSFKFKVTVAFLLAGLFPYLMFSFFSLKEFESTLMENVKSELKADTQEIIHKVRNELETLRSSLRDWAHIQIMDDILANDVDKRIAKFLRNIHERLGFIGYIICINDQGKIVASSEMQLVGKTLDEVPASGALILREDIHASFNSSLKLGELVVIYSFKNLVRLLPSGELKVAGLIGEGDLIHDPLRIRNRNVRGFSEIDNFLVLVRDFKALEIDWLVYEGISKDLALAPVKKAMFTLTAFAISGAILIVITALFISSRTLRPLEEITKTAHYIAKTGDYSRRVNITSDDEIGILSLSFNQLLEEIERVFSKLKEESVERLKLFRKLIDMLKLIMSQEEEERLLEVAVKELKNFLKCEVSFVEKEPKEGISFPIRAKVFDGSGLEDRLIGHLWFGMEDAGEEMRSFLSSVTELISFQIEKLNFMKLESYLRMRAESASRAKSLFIANMSHELRTPLNAIIGFAQYLSSDPSLDKAYRDIAKNIETSGRHLLSIINDILDLSKAEAGKLKANFEEVDLETLITEVEIMILPMAKEKGLELYMDKPRIRISTDPKFLKQILINLLSNAIKYTPQGHVKLLVEDRGERVRFRVIDTGIGIPKEAQEKIFEAFEQLENPMQKKYKGTGLGLALTKRLVHILKGEIGVFSEGEGTGSEFWFEIPKRAEVENHGEEKSSHSG